MNYLKLLFKAIGYNLYRVFGFPKIYPMNYTFLLTNICNSKCKTCNIWMNKKTDNELTYKEWEKIIIAIGKRADWITITSGEPFLNKDIDKIVSSVIEHNKPDVICIATNGLLTKQIINKITLR